MEDIARARVGTYYVALEVTNRPHAATPFEDRFSTQFCPARALVHDSVGLDAYAPGRLADPRVQRLMQRTEMAVDPDCETAFPRRRSAAVEVELADGRRLGHVRPIRRGDPGFSLSDAELEAKFLELASPVICRSPATKLLTSFRSLGHGAAVDFLADLVRPSLAFAG